MKTVSRLVTTAMKSAATASNESAAVIHLNPAWRQKWIGLEEHTHELRLMAEATERFCKRLFWNDRTVTLLVLCGVNGTGKSHCAKAAAKFARATAVQAWDAGHWSNPPTVSFADWAAFVSEAERGGNWERELIESSLTVLDDVGSESDRFRSGESIERLCAMLNARARKFTIVASNLTVEQWAEKDTRVADRLLRHAEVVRVLNTESWWERKQRLFFRQKGLGPAGPSAGSGKRVW